MNKQDILNQRRKKLLNRIEETAEGRAYLAERNDPTGTGIYIDSVKKMQMEEISKVEKVLESISRVNESAAVLKEIRSMNNVLMELAEKKIPAPIVNVQAPEVRVKIPEPTILNQTKTEVLVETKYQEATAVALDQAVKVLNTIAKNGEAIQVSRIKNAFNDPIPVQLVDKRGKSIMDFSDIPAFMSGSSTGGQAQYTEGDVKTTTVGTMMMWKSGSTVTAVATATPMPVAIISGAGSGGTAMVDDAAFTVATTSFTPTGGTYRATRDSVDSGDGGAFAMTATRALFTAIETPNGDSAMNDTIDAVKVAIYDSAGSQISTFGGGTQYVEDVASAGGETMTLAGLVRQDTPVANTSADGDYTYGKTDSVGRIWTHIGAVDGTVTISGAVTISGTPAVTVTSGSITADTELAVAAALADNTTNPTVTSVGTFPHWFDGTTWDRAIGNSVDGLKVNLGVDNDVTASQTGTWTVQPGNTPNTTPWLFSIHDGTTKATVRELGTNDALNVSICDSTGAQISTFGGGTQYTEDVAAATDPVGTSVNLIRSDTPSALVSANGDNVAQRGTNYGAAYTQVVTSAGAFVDTFGGGTQYTEDDGSVANPVGNQIMSRRRDTLTSGEVSAEGDVIALNSTSKGELYVKQTDSVAVTGTFYQTTQPVSIASSITLTADTELPAAATLADATTNPSTTNLANYHHIFNGTTWDRARSGTTTPSSTFTGMQNTMPWAKYDSTPTARTTGQGGPLQADANGSLQINSYTLLSGEDQTNGVIATQIKPSAASTYAPTRYVNFASSTAASVKASAGNVFSAAICNNNAAIRYLQIHNTASAPTASAVPLYTFAIPASGSIVIGNDFFTNAGAYFSTGIGFAVSTSAGTYTAATAADHYTNIHYI